MSGNETERKAWFTLSVELFGPQALYGDYTRFTSYRIHVRNVDNSIHGHWNEKDGYLLRDNEYYRMPFNMSGYDRFSSGCIPVPETSRLLLLGEYMARSSSGIWMEPGLLDLNMATQECSIAPLRMGDGSFRLREFYKEWVLVESRSNGNRTDYARLWNRKTDEVLHLRSLNLSQPFLLSQSRNRQETGLSSRKQPQIHKPQTE